MDEVDVAQDLEERFRDHRIAVARRTNSLRTETCDLVIVEGVAGAGCGEPIEEGRKLLGASSCLECQKEAEGLYKRGLWPV